MTDSQNDVNQFSADHLSTSHIFCPEDDVQLTDQLPLSNSFVDQLLQNSFILFGLSNFRRLTVTIRVHVLLD